jgi:catechol O-methyltransferase
MAEPSAWRKVPFFRWSFVRLILGMPKLLKEWQVGDGREEAVARRVVERARRGDPADAVRVIDEFAWGESFLINVGDEKGLILDQAVRRASARRILELGTYCGYSALRMAVAAPEARITSIEFSPDNAFIARRIFEHAGVADRITVVVGTLGDGGKTVRALSEEHGFGEGVIDLVFVDHAKEAYLPDLRRILEQRWLRPGALVVADNVKFPGAPDYRAYMQAEEGKTWRTNEHETFAEYQKLIKDLVLVSELLAGSPGGSAGAGRA